MSTHNIGFYEDLTKFFFESSSNTHLIRITSAGCVTDVVPFMIHLCFSSTENQITKQP